MIEKTIDIPVCAARDIAKQYGYDQIIIVGRKVGANGREHVTTYGADQAHCLIAAQAGNYLKHKIMGWPQMEIAVPDGYALVPIIQTERLEKTINKLSNIIHDSTVSEQAAWIEWMHGEGAEAAMLWIAQKLDNIGLIPGEDEPYSKEAQAYYDANISDPLPFCFCGRPSNILWMGKGFCCEEHYNQGKKIS